MIRKFISVATFIASITALSVIAQPAATVAANGDKFLAGHRPDAASRLVALSQMSATNEIRLAIGLPLRDEAGLQEFLADVYNPASPSYRKFLTPAELATRFGPTEADYLAVKEFARTNGLVITAEHRNRMLLDVIGHATEVEGAFHLKLQKFQHPTEAREFFAPNAEPSVSSRLPMADVQGLTDYFRPRPHFKHSVASRVSPRSGTSPDGLGEYFGDDFRKAYAAGTTNTGTGQIVGLLQFDGFYTNDIISYARAAGGGRTNIPIQTILMDGFNGTPTSGASSGNGEVSLDIEMTMAMAPSLTKIVVFEAGPNGFQNDILNSMLTFTNTIKQLSCSWGWSGGPTNTTDNLFQLIAAAGQSFFNASGDTDAFVAGSNNDVDKTTQANAPSSCPYITQVGGTELTNGANGIFVVESVWNDRTVNPNGGNWGSSGGISSYYPIPWWQTNTSMAANAGSASKRNIPDVALTANNIYSTYNNGSGGSTGGTSCSAPLWAGFMALVNQQAAANGASPVGFLNPAVYAIANSPNYNNCFHDTKLGDNSWSSSAGKFVAVAGYDLATGLGSPNGANLINALAPLASGPAQITTSPASQTNSFGGSATFFVTASGAAPLRFQWYFTNAIPGATSASLLLNNLVATNAGNYFVVVSNSLGQATSSVATLTILLSPSITSSPQSQSILVGQGASFNVAAVGAPTLTYQWRKNSNNIAGANSTTYSIATAATVDAGYYDVVATNFSGSVTSAVASLTVNNPASYSGVLAGWDMNGVSSYGTSPMAPTTNAVNVTVTGLTRGSGVTISGTAASRAWGGVNWSQTTAAAGVTANQFATFGIVAANGYAISYSSISKFNYRRSSSGPANGVLQFQLGNGAFTDIATVSYPVSNGSGGTVSAIDLSGVTALQNVPAGTNVSFRIVNYSANSSGGTWYVYDGATATPGVDDLEITGSLSPIANNAPVITQQPLGSNAVIGGTATLVVNASGSAPLAYQWFKGVGLVFNATNSTLVLSNLSMTDAGTYTVQITNQLGSTNSADASLLVFNQFYKAYDAGVGLSGGENVILTNASGLNLSAWSATDLSVLVTNWQLAGTMSELPLGASGNSRYGINLNPSTSPTYYIFARTNVGPYLSNQPLAWLLTDTFTNFAVTTTNLPISTNGLFVLPGAPAITVQPADTNVYAGKNVQLFVSATGSGTLSYQWLKSGAVLTDGGAVSGAQTNRLNIAPTATNNTGSYFVIITNLGGSSTSSVAFLNVVPIPTLTISNSSNGFVLGAMGGAISNSFIVQATTNLVPPILWAAIQTNVVGANAQIRFSETNLAAPVKFYRILFP